MSLQGGKCPASPIYKELHGGKVGHGRCPTTQVDHDNFFSEEVTVPCFESEMWTGESCCASKLLKETRHPDLISLAMKPKQGCDGGGSATFIAQALCLGRQNCTIDAIGNHTFSWAFDDESSPCGGGILRTGESFRSSLLDKLFELRYFMEFGLSIQTKFIAQIENMFSFPGKKIMCSISLASRSANFSSCPGGALAANKRRLIARASCVASVFSVRGWPHSRIFWSKCVSWIDGAATALLVVALAWLRQKETEEVRPIYLYTDEFYDTNYSLRSNKMIALIYIPKIILYELTTSHRRMKENIST